MVNCYGNLSVKTRYKDEATIEDVMLKIFPHGAGFNAYELSYFGQLMSYKKGNGKAFLFKEDKKSRIFNPPFYGNYKNLFYKKINRKVNIITKGITIQTKNPVTVTVQDESNTDDCRDESLKKYIIPYFICCGGQTKSTSSNQYNNTSIDNLQSISQIQNRRKK